MTTEERLNKIREYFANEPAEKKATRIENMRKAQARIREERAEYKAIVEERRKREERALQIRGLIADMRRAGYEITKPNGQPLTDF